MRIMVLSENMAGSCFQAEHGLSYLLEIENEKILFDSGQSDLFLRNARGLGFDLQSDVGKVVLSHGHWDHGNGLAYIRDKILITHPGAFMKRYRKVNHTCVGLTLSKSYIQTKFRLIETKEPYYVQAHVLYLGEIPRIHDFESRETSFMDEKGTDDFVPDDSALVVIQDDALIIVVGCAHAGICNIIDYARKITTIDKVAAVIGGFHLKKRNKQTQQTIDYLHSIRVKKLYPSHCTELPALSLFYEHFETTQVKTGDIFKI